MEKNNWKKIGNTWVTPTRVPGIWKKKGGGYLVRARVVDPMTRGAKEIRKVLDVSSEREAYDWLEEAKTRVRVTLGLGRAHRQDFSAYATSLFERKVELREIRSSAGISRWNHTLRHLIAGIDHTCGENVPGFGEMLLEDIRLAHVDRWRQGIARLIGLGHYSPNTANGWVSILRVVFRAAARELELSKLPIGGEIRDFDASDHVTYSEEAPQSLSPGQVPQFLALLRNDYPQHFAMTYLGLATGLRPSSLRPLRRGGDTPDVLWTEGRLLVRRSQTRGNDVLQTTKQKTRYSIELPDSLLDVLRWHVATQLETPEQRDSELLFPSINGGFRSPCVLNKPFAEVSDAMLLGYHFTQRGMRRTFNDLARAAEIQDLVTRSISGHLTEKMQHHYSTVRGNEQQAGLAKVIDLMTARTQKRCESASGDHGGDHCQSGDDHTKKPATG